MTLVNNKNKRKDKKVVFITGGSEGLGYEIAKFLTKIKKYQIVICSNDEKSLKRAKKNLKVDGFLCDVSNFEEVGKTIKNILNSYKALDVLINNAGLWLAGELFENDPLKIKKLIEVNLLGPIWCCYWVIPFMKKNKSGTIINIVSQTGLYASEKRSIYGASKFGLRGLTQFLEKDLKKDNIRVIGIYPGLLKTKLFEKNGFERDLTNALEPIKVAELIGYILETDERVVFPEIGVKHINDGK